jgi:hypothetical protein
MKHSGGQDLAMGEQLRRRYVVLRHEEVPRPHFDVMVETGAGSALATWRAGEWPPRPGAAMERLADHRAAYLTYEGPVSGGRGHVRRVAGGECVITGAGSSKWTIRLDDGGVLRLHQTAPESPIWHVQSTMEQ